MIEKKIQLGENEVITMTIRRHWFSLAIQAFANFVIFLIFSLGVVVLDAFVIGGESGVTAGRILPIGFFFLGFVGLMLWMQFFGAWSDHWLDAWIVTNERVIDIEQRGFFVREVSSFPLQRIQDVTYTIAGIVPTWLHFGDVHIHTASSAEDFVMRQIPFPQDVKEKLMQVMKEVK
jgi:uncharacterized membrane protein YdbT with pleckstrin-like domain